MEGILLQALGGFFYVFCIEGERVVECKVRRRLENEGRELLVGDRVEVSLLGDGTGVIESLLPRGASLDRPAVANIDQVLLTVAVDRPPVNFFLLDRMLIRAEISGLEARIVLNKIDIEPEEGLTDRLAYYRKIGYPVLETSAHRGRGISELRGVLKDRVSVFAGQSGVGKSALLNAVYPDFECEVGEVSRKTGQGRHTTRRVTLLRLEDGGFVADTPGFMRLEMVDIEPEQLSLFLPDFYRLSTACRFSGCCHDTEPGCAVQEAVDRGEMPRWRYEHYLSLLRGVREAASRRYS